jgi:transposase
MGFIHGVNRHEEILFPERLDDDIAEDDSVRFIDACVDTLDLEAVGFQRTTPAATGRPAYHPAALRTRYIDGDLSRLRSSRRLEKEMHRQIELRWLLKKLPPAHQTIADCRKNNLAPLRQICRAFTLVCTPLNRFAGELGAIDGGKFTAVNAKERHFTPDTLTRLLQPIDQGVEGSLQALDGQDHPDARGTPGGAVAENGPAQIAALPQRKGLYAALQAQLEASDATPLSRMDPGSRAMKRGKGGGLEVCDNAQMAVDSPY